jgi:SPP1 gp7 family putative phage head morphogenesis protein
MPDPLVVQVANDFRQQLLDRNETATRDLVRRWLRVEQALVGQINALAEELSVIRDAGGAVSFIQVFQEQRYQFLLAQLQQQLAQYQQFASSLIDDDQQQAVRDGLQNALNLLDATSNGAGVISATFDRLPVEAVENLVSLARAGQPLESLLRAAYPLAAEGITDKLVTGLALGHNPRQIAREVVRDGLSQGLNHILLVARDQTNRAHRTATIQQYQRSSVVVGYRRLAAKQPGRTCLACLALDGQIFPLDVPFSEHPQGRCQALPVIQDIKPVEVETGEKYFRNLPKDRQREWLGPGRYDLWQRDGFEFAQLATIKPNVTWGPSAQPTPLKDLMSGRSGGFIIPPLPEPQPAPPFP